MPNGLRFFCFLSVFLFHSFHTDYSSISSTSFYHFVKHELFGNGNLGVNFFFVLSGFLITYLLIEEKKMNGQIHVRNFWIRRILRIWPLFYLCVLFGFYAFPLLKTAFGQVPNETASLLHYLVFANNFDLISKGSPDASVLGALWSVAIEEQFYLFWPILLYLLPVKKQIWLFIAIVIGSMVYRAYFDSGLLRELHTFSCIGDMAMGAIGAWLMQERKDVKFKIENMKKSSILLIYILFFIAYFFRKQIFFELYFTRIIERPLIATFILLIILEQTYARQSFFKMHKLQRITQLGKVTYGLYCLHFIGILIATTLTEQLGFNTTLWQVILLETTLALSFTVLISSVSYKFFETPFLRMKDKFAFITR